MIKAIVTEFNEDGLSGEKKFFVALPPSVFESHKIYNISEGGKVLLFSISDDRGIDEIIEKENLLEVEIDDCFGLYKKYSSKNEQEKIRYFVQQYFPKSEEELEELDLIQAYDRAKAERDEVISFSDAIAQIEQNRT